MDAGSEATVTEKDLWFLPPSCTSTAGFALRCHLADIMPAGDITKWSRTACETLQNKLTTPVACFLAPKVHWLFNPLRLDNFLAYRNSAGYPTLRTQVKYEPRDIPQFGLKGLNS